VPCDAVFVSILYSSNLACFAAKVVPRCILLSYLYVKI
jgi:hypothetical protein